MSNELSDLPVLIAYEPIMQASATQLATRWGLSSVSVLPPDTKYALYLSSERLELRNTGSAHGAIYVDFTAGKVRYRSQHGGGRNQLIAKAAGIKKGKVPRILDATAGFAQDAFVFVSLGCKVTLIERSAIIAMLLGDGLRRAGNDNEIGELVSNNMHLIHADAVNFLQNLNENDFPDVIYLDPMYPEKNSAALVKKEMRVFRDIVGKDQDADKLLPAALEKARERVVVKRPAYAGWLNEMKPAVEMKSKKHRFDIYFTFAQTE